MIIKPENWVRNKRKKAHQTGHEYINGKGKLITAKSIQIKKDCASKCKFKCAENINKDTRERIFHEFYKLDTNGKHCYINQTTVSAAVSRNMPNSNSENTEVPPMSRKKKAYS